MSAHNNEFEHNPFRPRNPDGHVVPASRSTEVATSVQKPPVTQGTKWMRRDKHRNRRAVLQLNEELHDEILTRIVEGEDIVRWCKEPGNPSFTDIMWLCDQDPDFAEAYEQALKYKAHRLLHECVDIADAGYGNARDKGVKIETRFKMIEKLLPERFGNRVRQEITGKDGGAVEITGNATSAQILALIQQTTVKSE